jgi:hypothetical protein
MHREVASVHEKNLNLEWPGPGEPFVQGLGMMDIGLLDLASSTVWGRSLDIVSTFQCVLSYKLGIRHF